MRVRNASSSAPKSKTASKIKRQAKSKAEESNTKSIVDANKKVQYIKYTIYRADHRQISAANTFYTKIAKVVKTAHGYDLILTVKVQHGLVKFKPLTMAIGKITKCSFKHAGKDDYWTYTTHISSLAKLKHQFSATMRLSVSIVNIKNRIFKVWFVFGISKVAKSSVLSAATAKEASSDSTSPDNSDSASASASSSVSNPALATNNSATLGSKAKRHTPNTAQAQSPVIKNLSNQTMPEIALKIYPFLPVILLFLMIDAVVLFGVFILRKKILNRKS